jgi:hypothetical protein
MRNISTIKRTAVLLCCIISWTGIGLAFYSKMRHLTVDRLVPATVDILSFFTIQSNLLVGVVLLMYFVRGTTTLIMPRWLVYGALINITITAVVYHTILQGGRIDLLQLPLSELILHYITPILFLTTWLFALPKDTWKYKTTLVWLLFPIIFLVYSLWRGNITGYYPYPFIDVGRIGINQVLINSIGLSAVFVIIGCSFVLVNNAIVRRNTMVRLLDPALHAP